MPTKTTSTVNKIGTVQQANYINNPLKIAVEGTKLLFQKAPMIAIILAILSALAAPTYFSEQSPAANQSGSTMTDTVLDPTLLALMIIIAAVMLFGALIFGSIVTGIFAYTSAEIAKGREVSFKQAAKATFDRLWSFVWLQVLTITKVLLWTLLFVIPGIIMAIRYSLANVSFFDSDKMLTGNAAIKDSIALTKGAWVTTFSAQAFFNIITLLLISPIIDTASKAMLYRQFSALQQTNEPKPKPHALSWVTLGFFILVGVAAMSALIYAIANYGFSNIK